MTVQLQAVGQPRHARHILLIEDEPDLAEVVCWVLADAGHTVVTAETRDAGLAHLQVLTFDLVLVDGLSSDQRQAFANAVTVLNAAGRIPTVLFTAHRSEWDEVRAAVFADLIAKPFTLDEFTEQVQTLIGR